MGLQVQFSIDSAAVLFVAPLPLAALFTYLYPCQQFLIPIPTTGCVG
jgi:hypothetical protein